MRFEIRRLLGLCVLLSVVSCDSKPNESPAAPARVVSGKGIVRGRITFAGTPPVMKEIPNQPCHEGAPTLKEETVVVSDHGGLKNVLVSIEGIGPAAPFATETPVLDQLHCQYVPHVLAVTVGQEMIIRSSDDTIHNVHVLADANPPMNFAQTSAGQEKRVKFNKPEILRSKCDVHPWMSAYIAVMENPFFAVSGDDGEFEIKNVPAGSYKLVAWHEQFGKMEQPVIVTDEKPADVSVTYKAQ